MNDLEAKHAVLLEAVKDLSLFASAFIQASWDLPMLLKARQKRLAYLRVTA